MVGAVECPGIPGDRESYREDDDQQRTDEYGNCP